MAVTKRVRFEVFRRDSNACQYCGQVAPDVEITIDHVVPRALGGSDDPSNLITACKDCNAGKTSIQPDSPLVAAVAKSSLEWALAASNRAAQIDADFVAMEEYEELFLSSWNEWSFPSGLSREHLPLPNDWRATFKRWWRMSVPQSLIVASVDTAMGAKNVSREDTFRYYCGIIWRTIEQYDAASETATNSGRVYGPTELETFGEGQWNLGYNNGRRAAARLLGWGDLLRHHIDGTEPPKQISWEAYGELVGGAA